MASCNFAMSSALVLLMLASVSFLAGRRLSIGAVQAQLQSPLQPLAEYRAPVGSDPQLQPELQPFAEHSLPVGSDGANSNSSEVGAHIYFVLDRSGSMSSIRGDVIGGFNAFVNEQRGALGRLRMTLLQFDSNDPHEVVFAGRDIKDVPLLTSDTFEPRGMTPLYDALGYALAKAEQSHKESERLVLVTFSDGQENDSREHTREAIFAHITEKRKLGWTFVFLGANQDTFAESRRTGYGAGNTQNFKFDGQGTRTAFSSVAAAMSSMRYKLANNQEESIDSEDFFEGVKLAEDDYRKRSRQGP